MDVVGRPGEGGAGEGPPAAPFPGLYTAGLPDDGFVGEALGAGMQGMGGGGGMRPSRNWS